MTKKKEEVDSGVLVWHNLALLHGWNELAKKVETLGERVFCRGLALFALGVCVGRLL